MFNPETMKAKRIAGFRSHLEFQWALAFDACGIEYLYEPKLFTLDDGTHYLPDFYLPQTHTWVEVKAKVSEEERSKAAEVAEQTESRVVIGKDIPSSGREYEWFRYDSWREEYGESPKLHFDSFGCELFFGDQNDSKLWAVKHLFHNDSDGDYAKKMLFDSGVFEKTFSHLPKQGWHDYLDGEA